MCGIDPKCGVPSWSEHCRRQTTAGSTRRRHARTPVRRAALLNGQNAHPHGGAMHWTSIATWSSCHRPVSAAPSRARCRRSVTGTIHARMYHRPIVVPLPHPSPRDNIWIGSSCMATAAIPEALTRRRCVRLPQRKSIRCRPVPQSDDGQSGWRPTGKLADPGSIVRLGRWTVAKVSDPEHRVAEPSARRVRHLQHLPQFRGHHRTPPTSGDTGDPRISRSMPDGIHAGSPLPEGCPTEHHRGCRRMNHRCAPNIDDSSTTSNPWPA